MQRSCLKLGSPYSVAKLVTLCQPEDRIIQNTHEIMYTHYHTEHANSEYLVVPCRNEISFVTTKLNSKCITCTLEHALHHKAGTSAFYSTMYNVGTPQIQLKSSNYTSYQSDFSTTIMELGAEPECNFTVIYNPFYNLQLKGSQLEVSKNRNPFVIAISNICTAIRTNSNPIESERVKFATSRSLGLKAMNKVSKTVKHRYTMISISHINKTIFISGNTTGIIQVTSFKPMCAKLVNIMTIMSESGNVVKVIVINIHHQTKWLIQLGTKREA